MIYLLVAIRGPEQNQCLNGRFTPRLRTPPKEFPPCPHQNVSTIRKLKLSRRKWWNWGEQSAG